MTSNSRRTARTVKSDLNNYMMNIREGERVPTADIRGGHDRTSLVTEEARTSTAPGRVLLFTLFLRSGLGVLSRDPWSSKLFRSDSRTAPLSLFDILIKFLLGDRLRHLLFHTH